MHISLELTEILKEKERNSYVGLKHHTCEIVVTPFQFHIESVRRVDVLYSVLQLQLQVVT